MPWTTVERDAYMATTEAIEELAKQLLIDRKGSAKLDTRVCNLLYIQPALQRRRRSDPTAELNTQRFPKITTEDIVALRYLESWYNYTIFCVQEDGYLKYTVHPRTRRSSEFQYAVTGKTFPTLALAACHSMLVLSGHVRRHRADLLNETAPTVK